MNLSGNGPLPSRFGVHAPLSGGLRGSLKWAVDSTCNCLQISTNENFSEASSGSVRAARAKLVMNSWGAPHSSKTASSADSGYLSPDISTIFSWGIRKASREVTMTWHGVDSQSFLT